MSKTKRELEPDFLEEPESYAESVCSNNLETQIVDVDKVLNQIFGFRDSCTVRIPSFPEYLDNSSSSLSRVSRTRPVDDVGSEFVRHYSDSFGVEGNECESMLRAVALLDQMNSENLIDVDKLYKLIGISIARHGFVKLLLSTASTSARRVHFAYKILQDSSMRQTTFVKPSSIDTDTTIDLLCTMHGEKMISDDDILPLADRVGEDRILVSYLLCNVARERKAKVLPEFLRVIKSREHAD